MKESFELSTTFAIPASRIFDAWLDSESHEAMTGGEASCGNQINDPFTAWDGYIWGKNLELESNRLIVQSWRTSEFQENDEDSLLRIELFENEGITTLKLTHSNIPEGQTQYKQGWIDHYFEPMSDYFNQ